jgi:hypothetical protein
MVTRSQNPLTSPVISSERSHEMIERQRVEFNLPFVSLRERKKKASKMK